MWVKLLMGDYNLNNTQKVFLKIIHNHIEEKQNLQFFKNWTYILHNKNIFVKNLMKVFLNSHCIESYLWRL